VLPEPAFESSQKKIAVYAVDGNGYADALCFNVQYDNRGRAAILNPGSAAGFARTRDCGTHYSGKWEGIEIPHNYHCLDRLGNYQDIPQRINISWSYRSWAWHTKFGGKYSQCMWNSFRWGQPYGYQVSPGPPEVRESCLIGIKKLHFRVSQGNSTCKAAAGGSEDSLDLWTEAYDIAPQNICFPSTQVSDAPCDCAARADIKTIADTLAEYRALLTPPEGHDMHDSNRDLTELDQVLAEINSGVRIGAEDLEGDTNPPPESNPWTESYNQLQHAGGENQLWLCGESLPRNFKVAVKNSDGSPASGHPVTFSVTAAPAADWSFLPGEPGQAVTLETVNGTAETGFKLGTAAGDYLIKASCPNCCPNVAFTASALTTAQVTELRPHNCDSTGYTGTPLLDSVRVKAVNTLTGNPVSGRQVVFTLVSHPGGTGMLLLPSAPDPATTNPMGIAKAALTLGSIPGNYRVSAVCQSCEAGQEAVCDIEALPTPEKYDIVPGVSPLVLKKSPIAVVVTPEAVPPGSPAHIIARGPPGITLLASVEAVPNTGGHQHTNDVRPSGTITPASGVLNSEGELPFTYTAGEVGGQERLVFRVSGSAEYGDAVILVSVPGLDRLGPSPDYYLSGEKPTHPSNHYGANTLRQEIPKLAQAFKSSATLSSGGAISVNDMSLINGGVFDYTNNWGTPHTCHKTGTSVDLDRVTVRNRYRIRLRNMARKINALLLENPQVNCRIVFEPITSDGRCMVHLECPTSTACSSRHTDCVE
jgi:hypothetical protein